MDTTVEIYSGDTVTIRCPDPNAPDAYARYRGEKVLDHCRKLYKHSIAGLLTSNFTRQSVCIQYNEDFYLTRINEDEAGVTWPTNPMQDNWFVQEFEPDEFVKSFLKENNAWE